MEENEMAHGEIIIVRRGNGGDHDEHHGGVWKIAFADFMTAMMAFFLVMWLINASNEETKKAVASYFNPVKLMDTTSNPKGVRNPKYGVEQDSEEEVEDLTTISTSAKATAKSKSADKTFDEQALFVDPYAILSEIAGGTAEGDSAPQANKDFKPEQTTGMGLNAGTSFQDPFDPSSWTMQDKSPANGENPEELPADTTTETQQGGVAQVPQNDSGMMNVETDVMEKVEQSELAVEEPEKLEPADPPTPNPQEVSEKLEGAKEEESALAAELAEKVKREVDLLISQEELAGLELEVTANGKGATIVLSDKSQNGMFSIGSARPTAALVNAMAKVGKVIAGQEGLVEISGHTDGRKYQSKDYDNWRLSSARAQMAYYMLVRGGMQESRVEKIVGQADVNLKVPEAPLSAANRRIEVFLKLP